MSDEIKKPSVFDIFKQSAQTYEEALAKRESEKTSKKIERYRITSDGKFNVRILPLCPHIGEDGVAIPMDRKGYEYAVRQQFLSIKYPSKGGKTKKMSIPVVQTTQPGVDLPVDLIDTYVKIAKEYGDEDITKKVTSSGYYGGLKWNYQHAIYILDLDKKRNGPLLWMCSGAQYHAIEDEKKDVWDELRDADADNREQDPVASFDAAYPLTITRKEENKKTEYKFKLKTMGKPDCLSEAELNALLNMPRLDDEIYKYTRYQFEATLEALKQYDEMLEIDVCAQEDFLAAVEKLRAALPKDDTSHFDLASISGKGDEKSSKKEVVTIDTLWSESDANDDNGFEKDSDEYNELREKILQFIQDNKLDVRVSHSKSNAQLLEDVEDALNNNIKTSDNKEKDSEAEPENDTKSQDNGVGEEAPAETEKPVEEQRTRRRRRPTDEPSNDDVATDKPEEKAPAEAAPAEESPRRRRRR